MFAYRKKKLYAENVPVERILRKTGTPVYIYSRKMLEGNYDRIDGAFSEVPHIVCYAVKANTNSAVCRTLFSRGAGADIVSGGELYRSLRAGVPPSKTVYAGVAKTSGEIEYALRSNVLMFNAESAEELANIDRISRRLRKKARVALRVNPNVDAHTHKYVTTGKSENKFGIPLREAARIYTAGRYGNLDLCGIHCHIGSQITEAGPYALMAKRISKLASGLISSGVGIRYINLGGGLGIRYYRESPADPGKFSARILPAFRGLKVTFIIEPGRYIAGNAGIMVTGVVYRKKGRKKNFLIVDAGMNDLVRPTLYGSYQDIIPVKAGGSRRVRADVVGPVCETGDFLGKDRMLPWLEQGECLAVTCAGAYGFAMASQYNSRGRPAEVMVNGGAWRTVRSRENYRDLVRKEN